MRHQARARAHQGPDPGQVPEHDLLARRLRRAGRRRTYFGRDAEDLTLLQSATLAGTIALPSRYDPIVDRGAAKVRRNYVLRQMVQVGAISEARASPFWTNP